MIEPRTNVKSVVAISIAMICVGCAHAKFPSKKLSHFGRDYSDALIEFAIPYIGGVGTCNLQTHSNGWTQANIDNWEFAPCNNFSNGVAAVVVNGQTNTWSILAPDKPLYRFGRYYCGFGK